MQVHEETKAIVRWTFDEGHVWTFDEGHVKGLPFYCDPMRTGAFAVEPEKLATCTDAAVFRLFATFSIYQALRDVVLMRQQRSLSRSSMGVVGDAATMKRSIAGHTRPTLGAAEAFEEGCDVAKDGETNDCRTCPGIACHVKDATRVFNRIGDMGKLPTSAWLRLWRGGGVRALLDDVCREEASPTTPAALLVKRFAAVHRVRRKLATMFVSALSTPGLAPGPRPWFPRVDGIEFVVVDTNLARVVDALRAPGASKTNDERERWVREQAARIDLRVFRSSLSRVLSEARAGSSLRVLLEVEPRRTRGRLRQPNGALRCVCAKSVPVRSRERNPLRGNPTVRRRSVTRKRNPTAFIVCFSSVEYLEAAG